MTDPGPEDIAVRVDGSKPIPEEDVTFARAVLAKMPPGSGKYALAERLRIIYQAGWC